MKRIWSDQNKFKTWELVESTVAEVMLKRGLVPKSSLEVIENKSKFSETPPKIKMCF